MQEKLEKSFFLEFEIRFKLVSLRPCNSLLRRMRVISTTILETNKNVLVPLQTGESELIPRAKENNPMYFDLQRVIEKQKREHP